MTILSPVFQQELRDAGLQFNIPPGFSLVNPRPNDRVRYTSAIAADKERLEIRYHVVPFKSAGLLDRSASATSVNMNQLHLAHLMALIQNVAQSVLAAPNPFPEQAVRSEFGAHWGAVCRLELARSDFSQGFTECMLVALHRQDVADAYIFFMFEDYDKVARVIENNFYTLTFAEPI